MKHEFFYQDLFIQLKNRIPQNSKLVEKLTNILSIEKMAVYRRLRQEVPFTLEEIAAIAREFNISLDNMLGVDVKTTLSFRLQSVNEDNSLTINYSLLEKYLQAIKSLTSDPNGEISLVTNLLPQPLYSGFNFIHQLYHFKWQYYSTPAPANQIKPYHEIQLPDRLIQNTKDIFTNMKKIKTSFYILDNQIFKNFVNDVIYFNSIRLIKDEDVLHIKNELFQFLDYIEAIATKGFVDNPSNKVYIYISDISIDASYCYVNSQTSFRFALVWLFIFNSILTYDEELLKMMKRWIRSKIRTSILLSVTGEKQRTLYFDTQRKIVEKM